VFITVGLPENGRVDVFFADDSAQKGGRTGMGKLIAFGGVFVEEAQLKPLGDAIDAVAAMYGLPEGTEIKWSPAKDNWIHDNLTGADRQSFYEEILEAAAASDARAMVVVWDTGRTSLEGAGAFEKCLDYVWERVEMHLKTMGRLGIIVADRPSGGQKGDEAFLEAFLVRTTAGTSYVLPERVQLNILTTSSHLIRHLQLADLVTGSTTGAVAGNEFAVPLMRKVVPLLIRNYLGTIGGTGLKVFPDDQLVNLYFHVLGEDTYAKTRAMGGYTLPLKSWSKDGPELAYFADPGYAPRQ
jgi:hypothetical protein